DAVRGEQVRGAHVDAVDGEDGGGLAVVGRRRLLPGAQRERRPLEGVEARLGEELGLSVGALGHVVLDDGLEQLGGLGGRERSGRDGGGDDVLVGRARRLVIGVVGGARGRIVVGARGGIVVGAGGGVVVTGLVGLGAVLLVGGR